MKKRFKQEQIINMLQKPDDRRMTRLPLLQDRCLTVGPIVKNEKNSPAVPLHFSRRNTILKSKYLRTRGCQLFQGVHKNS